MLPQRAKATKQKEDKKTKVFCFEEEKGRLIGIDGKLFDMFNGFNIKIGEIKHLVSSK